MPISAQQGGHHRAQLTQQRQGNHLPHSLLGAIAGKNIEPLQRQHHADENPGDDDDHQRHHPHGMQLLDQQAEATADAAAAEQDVKQKQRRTPEHREHVDARTPEQTNSLDQ